MSYKTDFEAQVASLLASGSNITATEHRTLLNNYLSGKIAWLDALVAAGLTFDYDRLADNSTAPSTAEFSFNTARTNIYFSNSDGTDDLDSLLNLMEGGVINLYNKTSPSSKYIMHVTDINAISGSVYQIVGNIIYDTLGTDTDTYVFSFDVNTQTSAVDFQLTGNQMLFVSESSGGGSHYGGFSLNDEKPSNASELDISFSNADEKALFNAFYNDSATSKSRIVFRPINDLTKYFVWGADDLITWTTYNAVITGANYATNITDYTSYSQYVVEVINKV